MTWDKTSTIEYFQNHSACSVVIKEQTSLIVIRGEIVDFEELDLCSTALFEAALQLPSSGLTLAVTFHDDFLGIHLLVTPSDSNDPEISLPYQIPYKDLILEEIS